MYVRHTDSLFEFYPGESNIQQSLIFTICQKIEQRRCRSSGSSAGIAFQGSDAFSMLKLHQYHLSVSIGRLGVCAGGKTGNRLDDSVDLFCGKFGEHR
jgi:hypothetical protein